MKRQSRSEARRAAFTQIFMLNQQGDNKAQMFELLLDEMPECEDNLGYITSVVNGVDEKREELNALIGKYLKRGWTLSRISKAAHSILKLAIYEIKYVDDVPPKVAINEAVELAKEYCDEKDAGFVNGLLGSVVRDL